MLEGGYESTGPPIHVMLREIMSSEIDGDPFVPRRTHDDVRRRRGHEGWGHAARLGKRAPPTRPGAHPRLVDAAP